MAEGTDVQTDENKEVSVLGQFREWPFWREFIRLIIQEAITMFIISLGTSLLHIGRKNKNKEVKSDIGEGSDLASKAFGGYTGGYSSPYSGQRYPLTKPEEFPGI